MEFKLPGCPLSAFPCSLLGAPDQAGGPGGAVFECPGGGEGQTEAGRVRGAVCWVRPGEASLIGAHAAVVRGSQFLPGRVFFWIPFPLSFSFFFLSSLHSFLPLPLFLLLLLLLCVARVKTRFPALIMNASVLMLIPPSVMQKTR